MSNSFGKIFKISTFGESHGKAIGVVIDGCPSGIEINENDIQLELDRRKPGQSKITTQRKESDSVEVLSKFAKLNGINSDQWHLVTGEKDKIYHLARNSYFADEGFGKSITSDEDFLDTENILLIDQQRRIRGIYNGTIRIDMLRLIDDINTLL